LSSIFLCHKGLEEILKDPARRHYTLQMLPTNIVKNLFRKRKYIFCMVELLTMLTYLNLVELNSKTLSIKELVSIKLLKTVEFEEENYTKHFIFDNLNDIEMFANDLALHGSRNDCKKCTFDSRLYIHNTRNWSYLPKLHRNLPEKEVRRFARLRNIIDINDTLDIPLVTIKVNSRNISSTKRKSTSKNQSIPKRQKTKENEDNNNDQPDNDNDDNNASVSKQLRRRGYDKEDMNALSLLRKQRAEWSKEEDSFLLMCRVASILINPTSTHFVCVSKQIIRDELYKYLPNLSFDKTSKACQRRLMYMLKNARTRGMS
jgi:hypothetical protein